MATDEHSAGRLSRESAMLTAIGVAFLPWLVLAVGGMLLALAGVLFSRDSEPVLRVVVLGVGLFAIAVAAFAFARARREIPAAREATTSTSRSQGSPSPASAGFSPLP